MLDLMFETFSRFGHRGINALQLLGSSGQFLVRLLSALCVQLHFIGVLSCLIIIVSGLFIGMVVGLQGYNTLEKFGASSQLGQLLALSIARELGPVISALLFA